MSPPPQNKLFPNGSLAVTGSVLKTLLPVIAFTNFLEVYTKYSKCVSLLSKL